MRKINYISLTKILFCLLSMMILYLLVIEAKESDEEQSSQASPQATAFSLGQWVAYQIKRYEHDQVTDKLMELATAELKISLVSKQTIRDREFYWVEMLINQGKEQERIVKFLIDNDGIPLPEKLILKYGKMQAVELNLRLWEVKTRVSCEVLFEELTNRLNLIPFTRPISPGEETGQEDITLNLNHQETTLKCIKVSYEVTESKIVGAMWYTDQVPFAGLVKLDLTEDKYHTLILLSGYGRSGAKSLITEQPKKVDFQER